MDSIVLPNVSAVAVDGRAILIKGADGSGKSTLALGLIDRGATLIGDDGVMLRLAGGRCIAQPPPNTAGKIEIRGVGIVELETAQAEAALVLELRTDAARYVESPPLTEYLGVEIPTIALFPDLPSLVLRSEWALRVHGRVCDRQ